MKTALKGLGKALAILGALLLPPLPAGAAPQAKTPPAVERAIHEMFAVYEFSQAAVSPGGRRVAWVESLTSSNGAPSTNSAIYVADWETGGQRYRVTAACKGHVAAEDDVAWSPDGKHLAFLFDAGHPGQKQLYAVSIWHNRDVILRSLAWFNSHLSKAAPTSAAVGEGSR